MIEGNPFITGRNMVDKLAAIIVGIMEQEKMSELSVGMKSLEKLEDRYELVLSYNPREHQLTLRTRRRIPPPPSPVDHPTVTADLLPKYILAPGLRDLLVEGEENGDTAN